MSEMQYLVYSRSHNRWCGLNGAGYWSSIDEAGRYTLEMAQQECRFADGGRHLPDDGPSKFYVLAPECAASLAAVTAERDAIALQRNELVAELGATTELLRVVEPQLNKQIEAHERAVRAEAERDAAIEYAKLINADIAAIDARCRELEGALKFYADKESWRVPYYDRGGAVPAFEDDGEIARSILTPATPAAKPEEHPCSCGRPECKYDRHHGNGPYPAAKPETTTGGGAA